MHGASFAAIVLGKNFPTLRQQRQHLQFVEHALGRFHLHHPLDSGGHFIQRTHAQCKLHAPLTAKLIDEHAVTGVTLDIFK